MALTAFCLPVYQEHNKHCVLNVIKLLCAANMNISWFIMCRPYIRMYGEDENGDYCGNIIYITNTKQYNSKNGMLVKSIESFVELSTKFQAIV